MFVNSGKCRTDTGLFLQDKPKPESGDTQPDPISWKKFRGAVGGPNDLRLNSSVQ